MRSFEIRETGNGYIVKITQIDSQNYGLSNLHNIMTSAEYCFTSLVDMIKFLEEKLVKK